MMQGVSGVVDGAVGDGGGDEGVAEASVSISSLFSAGLFMSSFGLFFSRCFFFSSCSRLEDKDEDEDEDENEGVFAASWFLCLFLLARVLMTVAFACASDSEW